jgi:small nuclear ribonucleoprotein (snRNP)-like protein
MENKPLELLNSAINKKVKVHLKNGTIIEGILLSFDIHTNMVIKTNVELKNEYLFIRGDGVVYISIERE